MNLTKGTIIHGFTVKDVVPLPDCGGTLYKMYHDRTSAQLAWLKRDDRNKTFAIAFKTIPSDDTGVFHILEHSVLNGSAKYPVREPFVELLKSSMQTFLNAFTYPDKTMYPVSSRNDKDFMNLISVYMDAVFHPSIYTNPGIFYQEGWHYEIRNPEDEPLYKGVVLNEMKGAFSSVDETIIDEFSRMLFPDNCYRFVSGGDPVHIPDLTYEQFLETHSRFYHPSNARVFLDGDMNIDEVLEFIDKEYFDKYEKEEMDFRIPMQEIKPAVHHRYFYETAPGQGTEDLTQIAMAKIVSDFNDIEKNLAWHILADLLVENNEAPLKKNILDRNLGQDVELDLVDGIQQPWAVLNIRNTNEEHYDEIREVIRSTAKQLVEEGLDHSNILAALNQMEFRYREKHEPAGLMYAQSSMNAWLYEGEPETYLKLGHLFDTLRAKTEEGYFEKLLAEFLLEEDTLSTLIAVPSETLGEERIAAENARLHEAKESWGDDLTKYIELNRKLDEWQATPDTEEILNTLPKLSLSDVEKTPEDFPLIEKKIVGVPVLQHPADDTGIVYMICYFSLGGVTKDYLPSLGLYTTLLTSLRTKKRNLADLQKNIRTNFGSLSFWLDAYSPKGVHDACIPVIAVSCSVLEKNKDKVVPMILEIMKETEFTPETILPILKQSTEENRQTLIMNGHSVAMRRASAHYSAEGVFREFVGGYSSALYEKELEENYDSMIGEFINECEMYSDILFSRERMTASITGEENISLIEEMIDGVGKTDGMRGRVHYPLLEDHKEAVIIPAAISYSAAVTNFTDKDYKYDPKMQILAHILTYDYLWTEVRVKGGAYGTGFSISPNGNMGAYSYRDPDPHNSFQAYNGAGTYVRENADRIDLEQMIIGTVAGGDPLLSPAAKMRVADVRWFRGVTFENVCSTREKMLSTTAGDLCRCAETAEACMSDCTQVVIAAKEVIDQFEKEGFTVLKQL